MKITPNPVFNRVASSIGSGIRRIWGPDRWLAVAFALAAGLLFGFVRLASEVIEGETRGFDETVMLALRTPGDISQPIGPAWVHEMVRDFTALGSTGVLAIVTAGVVGFLFFSRKSHTALFVLLAVIGGVALGNLLKIGFSRPRPELVPHSVEVFTNSFPSGHAMMSAVVYLTMGNLLARTQKRMSIKIFLLASATFLTVLVGVSRVYLGVHWPSDVLAGWSLGACWALLCWFVMVYLQQRGKVEPENGISNS
jgi:undecaprenyl-diphosphatase